MAVTLSQLLAPVSEDEALDTVLGVASSLGLPVTAWQAGNPWLTYCRTVARVASDLSQAIPAVAAGAFVGLAKGGWADLAVASQYGETRRPAVHARHTVVLTCSAAAGPYTIAAGTTWLRTASDARFVAVTGGTLPAGGTLSITVEAETAGAAGNVAAGTITRLLSPLPGVSATNTAITQSGTDAESDEALVARASSKWATIAAQPPVDAYEFWSKAASSEVTEVRVDDGAPDGPGSLRVYLCGSSGPVASGIVAAVDAYLQDRKARTSLVTTLSVDALPVAHAGTVYVRAAGIATAQGRVEAALERLYRAIPIGGAHRGTDPAGYIFTDALVAELASALGGDVALGGDFVDVDLTAPAADVLVGFGEKAAPTFALTYVAV